MSIDGGLLTGMYAGLLAATTAAAVLADGSRGKAATERDDLDEYEVAFLTGGARLAAVVALVNLEGRGVIDLGDGLLRDLSDSGDLDLDGVRDADHLVDLGVELHVSVMTGALATATITHPVEVAAVQAVQGTKPATPWRVVSALTATKALARVRRGLVERGLLPDEADVERLQRRWRWLLPLLGAGALAMGAGGAGAPLLAAMLLTVAAMAFLARRRPERTRRGDRLLAELRDTADTAGLGLALAGTAGLRANDPALALAVEVPSWAEEAPARPKRRQSAREWWGSGTTVHGGGWWGGAGCGGGWGGSGGGGDGGGGCGGGGGGCGGGGCGGGG